MSLFIGKDFIIVSAKNGDVIFSGTSITLRLKSDELEMIFPLSRKSANMCLELIGA